MSDRKPQKGDRVRVSFEGVYVRHADGDHHIVTADRDWSHETPNGAVVEVLEPADDPSKCLVGEVRATLEQEPIAKWADNLWLLWGHALTDSARLFDLDVRGCKVIGVVPGTPAAEQSVSAEQVGQWESDDLELSIDPHEPVVLVQAETPREPRVFTSEIEPPADVARVINGLGDTIERIGDRWWYTTQHGHPVDPPEDPSDAWTWPSGLGDGPYVEALS